MRNRESEIGSPWSSTVVMMMVVVVVEVEESSIRSLGVGVLISSLTVTDTQIYLGRQRQQTDVQRSCLQRPMCLRAVQ